MDYLNEVERLLDIPPAKKREVMRELSLHYQEIRDSLVASGMDPAQAEQEAIRQLGDPKETALRLNPVHCRSSWGSVMLAALPFLLILSLRHNWLVTLLTENRLAQIGMLILAVVYAAIMLRELIAGRRPIWLATWLAAGLGFGYGLLALCIHLGWLTYPDNRYVPWLLPLVVLPVCWKEPKWRTAALVISALFVTFAALHFRVHFAVAVTALLVFPAAWIMVGIRTFGAHRFGHPVLASLFVYTYFLIGLPLQLPAICSITYGGVGLGIGSLFSALAVLAFGRERSRRRQLAWLVCGIFAWAAALTIEWGSGIAHQSPEILTYITYVAIVAYPAIASLVVVMVPLVMMRSMQVNRPEAVR